MYSEIFLFRLFTTLLSVDNLGLLIEKFDFNEDVFSNYISCV